MESKLSEHILPSFDQPHPDQMKNCPIQNEKKCYISIDSILQANEPFIILKNDSVYEINPTVENLLGINRKKILHHSYYNIIHPIDRKRIIKLYNTINKDKNMVFQYKCRIINKHKEIKWIHVVSIRFTSAIGNLFLNYITDITNKIEKEQKQQQLFDMFQDIIVEFDVENYKIPTINTAMVNSMYQKSNEMIGEDLSAYLSNNINTIRFNPVKRAFNENRVIENFCPTNDMFFKNFNIPTTYKTGKNTVMCVSNDIDTHTSIKNDLQTSEQGLREIFNASIDAYLIINPSDSTIIDANVEAKKRFGFKPEDFGNTKIDDIIDSSVYPLTNQSNQYSIDTIHYSKIDKQDFPLKTKKNGSIWHEITTKLIEINGEHKLLMIARNVNDRKFVENRIINYYQDLEKKVEGKTKELNDMLTERELLLEEIHHRVKNNLQIITSLIDLQSGSIENNKQCMFLKTLNNRIFIMSLLHEQLYKSKDFKCVNLGEYLQGIVENLKRSLFDQTKRISINVSETNESIDLKKAISCGLIINELVSNAIKHAFREGMEGYITIDVSSTIENYTIKIKDNGIGFPEHITFDQAPSLGLQLVNMLIRQLNGLIHVRSNNGTQITMKFPK